MKDEERIERIRSAMKDMQLDVLVCTLPKHVLLLSGYWPVIGNAVAAFTREGEVKLAVPEDEIDFARQGWADEIHKFQPASLDELPSAESLACELVNWLKEIARYRVGYELGPGSEPATYSEMNVFGGSLIQALKEAAQAQFVAADEVLNRLTAVKTSREVAQLRHAGHIAESAYLSASERLRTGMKEVGAADLLRSGFSLSDGTNAGTRRADGFAFCMSGPNAAKASGAFAKSRDRAIESGDFVLMHANSYYDGFWTDITRTYVMGAPAERQSRMYDAVMTARGAALERIRPGTKACEVDRAARDVLTTFGFTKEFKHPTGHGIGFGAISPNALPQIHPRSQQVLETGMVFNVEPAIYIDGEAGLRHCDMVTVTDAGVELLTPFQAQKEELICRAVKRVA